MAVGITIPANPNPKHVGITMPADPKPNPIIDLLEVARTISKCNPWIVHVKITSFLTLTLSYHHTCSGDHIRSKSQTDTASRNSVTMPVSIAWTAILMRRTQLQPAPQAELCGPSPNPNPDRHSRIVLTLPLPLIDI